LDRESLRVSTTLKSSREGAVAEHGAALITATDDIAPMVQHRRLLERAA
jgi:hypothetical protein